MLVQGLIFAFIQIMSISCLPFPMCAGRQGPAGQGYGQAMSSVSSTLSFSLVTQAERTYGCIVSALPVNTLRTGDADLRF